MEIRRYTEADAESWDRFVADSANGTFMHSRRFLSYHPPERFEDHSLVFVGKKGNRVAVFPAAVVDSNDLHVLQSHPGATYGGFVVDGRATIGSDYEIVDLLVEHAREQEFDAIRMRVPEKIFLRRWCDEVDTALFRAGFSIIGRELSCAFRLDGIAEDEILSRFADNGQRNVRKAMREGVVARETEDYEGFWKILRRNLETSHGVKPTHTLEEMTRLRELMGPRVMLVGAYQEDELLAGSVLFFFNDVAAHTMYLAQDYEFQQLRPLNLTIHEVLVQCHRRGVRYVNFGVSSEPGTRGLEVNMGLHAFKRSCGGEGVVRDVLEKVL